MNGPPLRLRDLPSIDETRDKFLQRENNLKRIGYKNAAEIIKLKNNVTLNFISENFEMLEYKDKELTNWTLRNCVHWGIACLVFPSIGNLMLTRLAADRIFNLHFMVRMTIRLSFYAFPLFFWTDYAFGAYARITLYLCDKYVDRVEVYEKLKDPKIINPYLPQEQLLKK
jgi:hypothetical protein